MWYYNETTTYELWFTTERFVTACNERSAAERSAPRKKDRIMLTFLLAFLGFAEPARLYCYAPRMTAYQWRRRPVGNYSADEILAARIALIRELDARYGV